MALTIALFGAGGNMGGRVTRALRNDPDYTMLYIETGERGLARLKEQNIEVTPQQEALAQADVAFLAVPDHLIGPVAENAVPHLKSGALVMCLDPAAPYAGKLPKREDISYFVTHPAHPPVFNDEVEMSARRDFFGSGEAKQAIVNALVQGPEEDYTKGEAISAKVFGPILRSHRMTVEQMALLEPALSETLAATCLTIVREGLDEVVKLGVPAEAARDFLMGHLNVELAIIFNEIDWDFSAGAKKAIAEARSEIFQPEWKKIFTPEKLQASVAKIVGDA